MAAARRIYEKYVGEGKGGGHQQEYHQGSDTDSRILGNDCFIGRVLGPKRSMLKSKLGLEGIWREVCKCFSVDGNEWKGAGKERRLSEARGMAACLVLESGMGTLVQLGKLMGGPTTLSSAAKRLQRRAQEDLKLAKRMKQLLETRS